MPPAKGMNGTKENRFATSAARQTKEEPNNLAGQGIHAMERKIQELKSRGELRDASTTASSHGATAIERKARDGYSSLARPLVSELATSTVANSSSDK
jgi:hypothetical protein